MNRRGLTGQAKLVVGMPMISSSQNLAFWLTLSNAWGVAGSTEVLRLWQAEEGKSKEEFRAFAEHWNADLVRKVSPKSPML